MIQFHSTEPSLQIIAASKVAVSLWTHINAIPDAEWKPPVGIYEVKYLYRDVLILAKSISLPKSVNELIEKYTKKVYEEIEKWLNYHKRTIFFDAVGYRLICNFRYFIWYHDCTINYIQTARNLQNSISLAETDKFRFLCVYCLKDEIEKKWRLLVQNEAIGSVGLSFDNTYPLIHYWRYFCKNRLQDVPFTQGLSIDEFMFRNDKVDNWPAKEYFFERMNVDQQIQSAMWMVDRRALEYQKFVILKLNQSQRYTLYVNRSGEILNNYAQSSNGINEILPAWFEMAEIITEEDFVTLLVGLFTRKLANDNIIAQIWISAPDKLKLRVLNYKNEEFVKKIGEVWMEFYDDSFRMLLDASTVIRNEVLKTTIFSDYCEMLQKQSKFSILERVLRLCFPKDEEFTSMKQKLSQMESFTNRCIDFIRNGKYAALEQLFNFFSDVVDLNVFKEEFVNKEYFRDKCRWLSECGEISALDELLTLFLKPNETKKRWRGFFGEDFIIERGENLINGDKSSKLDEFLNCFHFTVEESIQFKRNLYSKTFFTDHCHELINDDEFSILKQDFDSLFPCIDELNRFKDGLSKKKFVVDHCENLIITDELTKLDTLLSLIFPDVAKSLEFKLNFTTKKFFDQHCIDLIKSIEVPKLEKLLKWFYPNAKELVQFKQRLTRKKFFIDHCQSLITDRNLTELEDLLNSSLFPSVKDRAQFKQDFAEKKLPQFCQELIIENHISTANDLLKLFFPPVRKTSSFKKILLEKNWFICHCEKLILSGDFSILNELLKWSFIDDLESNQFRSQLAESKKIQERCLHFYETENFKELSDLLSSLFLSGVERACEFKRNLILSEKGIEMSLKLAEKSKNILDNFIVDCLPTSISVMDFKKQIIFSPVAVCYLRKVMLKELTGVKKCLNRFLTSAEDKKELKMRLLDNAVELFTVYFHKLDQFTCQTRLKWWLPDKTTVEECKQKLSVDEVFEAGFKTCVFESFDPHGRVTRCIFRKDFNFESLDRFLKWYFDSSKEIKEFKMRKIQTYESMETISVLLKSGGRYSYFKQLLDWFFENDAVEMAKFKKKHKGEKIASMINSVVGESYSKRRRTL